MICKTCGTTLADNTMYCPECGSKVSVEERANENSNNQNGYQQNGYNQQMNGYQQNGYNQQMNGYQQNGYQQMNGYQQNGYNQQMYNQVDSHTRYKRSVLPFKVVGAVMNFIAMIFVACCSFAAVGISEGDDNVYELIRFIDDGFELLGTVGLIITFVLFILFILGLCLPAKGGVSCNFVALILGVVVSIWTIVLSAGVKSDLADWGVRSESDAYGLMVGMMVIAIIPLFFYMISLIMSIIGFTKSER